MLCPRRCSSDRLVPPEWRQGDKETRRQGDRIILDIPFSLSPCQEEHMARYTYDITIIGGGSGGLTAARLAQALGARVALIDKERLGGDCLHYGCVPSKSLIHVAKVAQQARHAAQIGLAAAELTPDMAKVTE